MFQPKLIEEFIQNMDKKVDSAHQLALKLRKPDDETMVSVKTDLKNLFTSHGDTFPEYQSVHVSSFSNFVFR
jgi:hypothetical protein